VVAPLTFALAGTLFVSSATTSRGVDLRGSGQGDLVALIQDRQADGAQVSAEIEELRRSVATLSAAQNDAATSIANARADALALQAGLLPVTGPGLVVSLTDAPKPVGTLPTGLTLDDFVVHQQDVQAVVNALWAGGAEAMGLQDQRVVSTTAVRCVGNTLLLHGRVYSPPYVVTVIGDPVKLRAALRDNPGVQIYQEYVKAVGLGWSISEKKEVTLPGYTGPIRLSHARPL
jgi:uncharacterized protein YlxW (UPF0749 family)